jgi:hypothetical protein
MKLLYFLLLIITITSCNTVKTTSSNLPNQNTIQLQELSQLAPALTETSGLVYNKGYLITHNDSGDTPTLYLINSLGKIVDTKTYSNMQAVDWEDITKDNTHLFIADIGNNRGNRKDLVIYKIALKDIENTSAAVTALHFTYPDQTSFIKGNQDHSFDAESIIAIDDYLYVFSKDWKNQITTIYQLNKDEEYQIAKKIMSYPVNGLITGATYNDTDTVMLCGYQSDLTPFVYQIDYKNGMFTFNHKEELPITGGAQVEGITYASTKNGVTTYYVSCEATRIKLGEEEAKSPAYLFKLLWQEE